MRAYMIRSAVAAALWAGLSCPGAETQDSRIERAMRSLRENPVPALRADEAYIRAARKERLAVPAGWTFQRRRLLARVFPHLVFPDSAVERMALTEEFISFQCPEQREPALAMAWSRYAGLAAKIPDSLLPSWESLAPFLRTAEMQAIPACRAKLLVKSSPGRFREECAEISHGEGSGSEAAPDGEPGEALAWSPACLQIRPSPPGACLVLAQDGKGCQVTADEFNALSGDYRIPAQGTIAEGRTDLLRSILEQDFRQGNPRVPVPEKDAGKREGAFPDWKTPVSFQAASDTSRFASGAGPWLQAYLEDLPPELYPLRDSAGAFASPVQRETRYGYFRIRFDRRDFRPARADQGLLREAQALAQALGDERSILRKNAGLFYAGGDTRYCRPDTLAYSLWLSASPAPDTAVYRPVQVRSTGVFNGIDSLAWRYSLGRRPDTLLGPFPTAYGTALLRLRGKAGGEGKIPFDSAMESIRTDMARGLILGSALGLLQDQGFADADPSISPFPEIPLPRFKDKEELIQAMGRLRYGPQGAGKAELQSLAGSPQRLLEDMYRIRRQERDQAAWIKALTVTPEAQRFSLSL